MQADFDRDLLAYFTDVEYLLDLFKASVAAPTLTKRLLVIHGVGGVGKSSLLRMFRLHCKSVKTPVALVSGDEAKSAVDVFYYKGLSGEERGWVSDLKADGVRFPKFDATLQHYRAIQAMVGEQAKKAGGRAVGIAVKAASKTAEAAGSALAGAAIGSVIPGIGTAIGGVVGGVLGGVSVEALIDWLLGFLKQPDIDLLLDPAKKLTNDFLNDVAKVAGKRRIVLMLDTFEQMTALDDWTRDVAQRLHPNILLVIAGRAMPSKWMAYGQLEELKPMTKRVMHELVRRYYATLRGGEPDPKQVDSIIEFARGLPLAVTTAVQLWVIYKIKDFQAVKPEAFEDLVDKLRRGLPKEMYPFLEVAAALRWFNRDILRALSSEDDVNKFYEELRRFPFVRSRVEGLALHDRMREIFDDFLRVSAPQRHRELHERAAVYFEARLEKATSEDAERLALERLYHRIRADEETGIKLFQEMAEELVRYRLINRLRALMSDVNTYPLEWENSRLWREYYNARLVHLEGRPLDAEQVYQLIVYNEQAESKLRAYALSDWGALLRNQRQQVDKSIQLIEHALSLAPLDPKLADSMIALAIPYRRKGNYERSTNLLERARDWHTQVGDNYGATNALLSLKDHYLFQGRLKEALLLREQARKEILSLKTGAKLLELVEKSGWVAFLTWFCGRVREVEEDLFEALEIAKRLELPTDHVNWNIGYVLSMEDRYLEAESYFTQSVQLWKEKQDDLSKRQMAVIKGFWGGAQLNAGLIDLAEDTLQSSLEYKQLTHDFFGIPELCIWLGKLYEVKSALFSGAASSISDAETSYRLCLDLQWTGRRYFECAALTGLVRIKHAQGDYAAIPPLLAEAEGLAQQYEYNDHLASLRLTQGHIAWEGNALAWENGFDAALCYYQHALIYALRYNRFLLDEVLSGRPQGTPLRPIIPECLKRGEEGRRMLIALRDWWQTGVNDIGAPRPDTISPIPEGIPLLEAECIAREREPGDGSPQKSVVEQIENALQKMAAC